jgi:FHA domain
MSNEEEDKTRIVRRPLQNLQGPPPLPTAGDADSTRRAERGTEVGRRPSDSSSPDDGKTRVFRPSPNKRVPEKVFDPLAPVEPRAPVETRGPVYEDEETVNDPVVGWLVVVKGPGRGRALSLGYGFNSIGRDPSQRVRLDFGDSQISRLSHAKLFYDPKSRKFMMTLGEGINPTYVRTEALLVPTEIKSGDRIVMGQTELLFTALCGENFEWSENA